MDASTTAAVAFYLTFYILLGVLFILWVLSIFFRCFGFTLFSWSRSRTVGPTSILLFTNNHEVPRGLETSVIEAFPKFLYSSERGTKVDISTTTTKMTGECVVCLGAFEENETLRLLPQCGHVFHAECVDVWLRSHATCPFCRANLLPENGPGGGGMLPPRVDVVIQGGGDGV